MSSWVDIFSFILTFSLFIGAILGVAYVVKQVSLTMQNTKESLKNKGWNISETGVSVKTSKRFDREDYLDSTQRTLVKALGSSSYGDSTSESPKAPVMERISSSLSTHSANEEKKKGFFKRSTSGRSLKP